MDPSASAVTRSSTLAMECRVTSSREEALLALTLWQPWAWCIAHGTKRVENRDDEQEAWGRGAMNVEIYAALALTVTVAGFVQGAPASASRSSPCRSARCSSPNFSRRGCSY